MQDCTAKSNTEQPHFLQKISQKIEYRNTCLAAVQWLAPGLWACLASSLTANAMSVCGAISLVSSWSVSCDLECQEHISLAQILRREDCRQLRFGPGTHRAPWDGGGSRDAVEVIGDGQDCSHNVA
ncbi:unnamed protein product [Vitrella brassicaformis CCMP3155]|uniref:Uncharacterized protein n=1 Tax=Vitrella brassicaformis (strain CCMP3155) TaxID=1169540 RepID=A0A0G4GTY3_VITBC|nr:unnamed protein product [Vitrella brassicaformis CCMP3155]|eukprot:CEM34225.1 unnamed protein product [Vitrella brassicaformis CCMP3155]